MAGLFDYLAPGKPQSYVTGINPTFQNDLAGLLANAKQHGYNVSLNSGYRDPARQAQILEQSLGMRHGSEAVSQWRNYVQQAGGDVVRAGEMARPWLHSIGETAWVAPPGASNHQKGLAADLGFNSPGAEKYVHSIAPQYGTAFRLGNEGWHLEPTNASPGAVGSAPGLSPGIAAAVNAGTGVGPAQQLVQPGHEVTPGMAAVTNVSTGVDPVQALIGAGFNAAQQQVQNNPPAPQHDNIKPIGDLLAGMDGMGGGGGGGGASASPYAGDIASGPLVLRPFQSPDPGGGGDPLGGLSGQLAQQGNAIRQQAQIGAQPAPARGQSPLAQMFLG